MASETASLEDNGTAEASLPTLAVPVAIAAAARPQGEAARHLAALAAAAFLHAGALLWTGLPSQDPLIGLGGGEANSVSVEIVPASALVARERISAVAVASAAPIEESDGRDRLAEESPASQPQDGAPQTVPEKQLAERPDIVLADWKAKLDPFKPDEITISIAPEPVAKAVEHQVQPDLETPVQKPEQIKVAAASPVETGSIGGAAASGNEATQVAASGQADAASGESMNAYNRTLVSSLEQLRRQAERTVARQRNSSRGKVVLRLTIGRDGGAEAVSIDKSSGRPELDRLALAEAQSYRFPTPPVAASMAQRTYFLPFIYR